MGKAFKFYKVKNMKKETVVFNIRESRILGENKTHPKKLDEVKEHSKRHFEEIFNRI